MPSEVPSVTRHSEAASPPPPPLTLAFGDGGRVSTREVRV